MSRNDLSDGVRGSIPLPERPNFVDLDITGMTCAACASRIERKLNKLEGVSAAVNYATEKAHVQIEVPSIDVADLIATIEATGYGARPPSVDSESPDRAAYLRKRLIVAVALGLPVLLLSMIPAAPVRWLAMGGARARHTRGDLGRVAVPSGDGVEPPSPPDHDGHAHIGGRDRRLLLVALGPAVHPGGRGRHGDVDVARRWFVRRELPHLPRGVLDSGRVHPGRTVLRGSRQTARW